MRVRVYYVLEHIIKKNLIFRISFIIYIVFICVEILYNSKNETKNVLNARDVN